MTELEVIVFATSEQARWSGFRENGRHHNPRMRNILATWPSQDPERWRGLKLYRVTVSDSVHRFAHGDERRERELHDLLSTLRTRLFDPDPIWIDL